ncbi:MAG TPA: peptidase S8 [Lutibacter sp.]|nr:peptidase S8 [Lutibacter sp.]
MKITRLLFGISLAIAISSCGTTKTTTSTKAKTETTKEIVKKSKETSLVKAISISTDKKHHMSVEEIQKWPHMDIQKDSVPGMSLARAYEYLKDKKGVTVIVGVIDSGIDIEHEDLKNVIWTNKDEIANNGKDDDNNGYIDDIHGWNFLGGKKGASAPEQLEITRMVKKMHDIYADENKRNEMIRTESKGKNDERVKEKLNAGYKKYLDLKSKVDEERKTANDRKAHYVKMLASMKAFDTKLKNLLSKETYTKEDVEKIGFNDDEDADTAKRFFKILESGSTIKEGMDGIQGAIDYFASKADTMYNIDFKGRVTGDNPDDIKDTKYGNNLVIGSKDGEIHGTHVSGIICAERNNGIGMNGVAHNVALMSIRAVPDGDEYDKDVALAIRYAVDNGAKVINMSFGKSYSPHPRWVYDAISYAERHDVLLVHAAGNDHKSIDTENNFPNDSYDKIKEFSDNVLTVGAMTRHYNAEICSSFSNYGKLNVDIFAPGSEIYSTFPKDEYQSIQGTSMASPQVAGVAALIRSYFPSLSASQVKQVIMESGIEFNHDVKLPAGRGEKVKMVNFSTLSVSGKILNAYNAMVMAEKMVNQK